MGSICRNHTIKTYQYRSWFPADVRHLALRYLDHLPLPHPSLSVTGINVLDQGKACRDCSPTERRVV